MSNRRTCDVCGAYGDPPPCVDWERCNKIIEEKEDAASNTQDLEERIEHLEALVRGLVGDEKFNEGLE